MLNSEPPALVNSIEASMRFRIAAVSFLNTVPLIDWFSTPGSADVALVRALPSRLAPLLEAGEADVALLPVVELFRGRAAGIIPGSGIACRGRGVTCSRGVAAVGRADSNNISDISDNSASAQRGRRSSDEPGASYFTN